MKFSRGRGRSGSRILDDLLLRHVKELIAAKENVDIDDIADGLRSNYSLYQRKSKGALKLQVARVVDHIQSANKQSRSEQRLQDLEREHVKLRSAGHEQEASDPVSLTDASSASSDEGAGSSSVEGFDAAIDEGMADPDFKRDPEPSSLTSALRTLYNAQNSGAVRKEDGESPPPSPILASAFAPPEVVKAVALRRLAEERKNARQPSKAKASKGMKRRNPVPSAPPDLPTVAAPDSALPQGLSPRGTAVGSLTTGAAPVAVGGPTLTTVGVLELGTAGCSGTVPPAESSGAAEGQGEAPGRAPGQKLRPPGKPRARPASDGADRGTGVKRQKSAATLAPPFDSAVTRPPAVTYADLGASSPFLTIYVS
eukprot:jgi/Botrbrau1/17382/Bobra.0491s0003.1